MKKSLIIGLVIITIIINIYSIIRLPIGADYETAFENGYSIAMTSFNAALIEYGIDSETCVILTSMAIEYKQPAIELLDYDPAN